VKRRGAPTEIRPFRSNNNLNIFPGGLAIGGALTHASPVPTFEVTKSDGWFEAACPELGVTITARRLEQVEATARRTAARALGAGATVDLVMAKKPEGVLSRLAWFLVGDREGNS
jgi:hypothetical protein